MTVTRAPECVILVWAEVRGCQPIRGRHCDQVTNGAGASLPWSHIPLSVWDHNRRGPGSPLLRYDSWSIADQGGAGGAHHGSSDFLSGQCLMSCNPGLRPWSCRVGVRCVYISSIRGNPIKVSPRFEIHEKMRTIFNPQPQTGAESRQWPHVVTTQSWGSDIAHKKSSQ